MPYVQSVRLSNARLAEPRARRLRLNSTPLANALNPANNFFNGSVTVGTLAPAASTIVRFAVVVNADVTDGTPLVNVAGLTSAQTPPVTAQVISLVISTPMLALMKIVDSDPIAAGDLIVYTLSWANVGADAATQTALVDTLPVQTTFVSASAGGVYDPMAGTVTWNLGTLAVAGGGSVTVTLQAPAPAAAGTIVVNTATLFGDGVPSVTAGTQTPMRVPLLTLIKTAMPTEAAVGEIVLFELSYANIGDAPASGVVLTDLLPPGTEPVAISNGGVFDPMAGEITWSLGTLAASASGMVSVEVLLVEPLSPVVNLALLESTETLPITARAEVILETLPAIEIPTLSQWGALLLTMLLGLAALRLQRRL